MATSLASMAWRNLWRNGRRTFLTLVSIAFGTMLAVLFTGMGDSNWSEMIDLAARLGGGHVTLQHPEYQDSPTFSRTLPDAARLRERALADPEVLRATMRISGNLMLASPTQNYGAGFIAFDPAFEDVQTLSLLEAIAEGRMFEDADDKGVILGAKLAEKLNVSIGRKVVFTMTDKQGEIVMEATRVIGLIRTGSGVDAALCLFPIGRLRHVLGYGPDETTQIALFLGDQREASATAERLAALLGPSAAALPWHEIQPELAGFIAMKVAGANFFGVVIMLLVAAGIFNTLFVSVMERVREFGIMLAIGFSPGRLFALVMCESFWLGVVGLATAGLLTALPYWYLSTVGVDVSAQIGGDQAEVAGIAMSTVLHVRIYPDHLLAIGFLAFCATMLSGLLPAWNAGRVVPVESIRIV